MPHLIDGSARLHRLAVLLVLACTGIAGPPALAQDLPWTYLGPLDAGEPASPPAQGLGTRYGQAVDVDGGWVAVGAPFRDLQLGPVTLADVGAVYLYRRDADGGVPDTPTQVIRSPVFEDGARFGHALAIDDGTLMIGAPGHGPATEGRVEFWRLDPKAGTWGYRTGFNGGVSQTERLGQTVALDGHRAAAGAPGYRPDSSLSASGRVQVFARSAAGGPFVKTQSILPISPVSSGAFGSALAVVDLPIQSLAPDRLVIGEPGGGVGVLPKGLVWIYEAGGADFGFSRLLAADAAEVGSSFGIAVASTADRVYVGGRSATRVLVERRTVSGWTSDPPLEPPPGGSATNFGWALDVSGQRVLVGQPVPPTSTSRAHVFEQTTGGGYSYRTTLAQPGGLVGAWLSFGLPVALEGRLALIGAPEDEVGGVVEAGRVAVFAGVALFSDGFEPSID